MKLVKVAAGILNQTPFDWDHNAQNIKNAIEAARQKAATVLCLPELCITGYGCEDDFFRAELRRTALRMLDEIAPSTRGMIVSVGMPLLHNNAVFNCGALLVDGILAGIVAKKNLAGDGIHYEPRWFEPWSEGTIAHTIVNGRRVPIGDIHFLVGDIKIGYEICEDAWVYNRPGNRLAASAVDIILNPSASHFAFSKLETRKQLVLEGSRAFGASYVYSNLIGNEAGRAIYDGGAIIASAGKILSIGRRFTFQDFDITTAVIDVDNTRMMQARTYSFTPRLEDDPACIEVDFKYPDAMLEDPFPLDQEAWEKSPYIKEEEFTRSISLGLFDYLRKSKSKGFAVSLSGGADSSAVSCLVALMVELSLSELGLLEFRNRLAHIERIQKRTSDREIIGEILTLAYQSTQNSSDETRNSAEILSKALGARFFEFDVEDIVNKYTQMVGRAIGRAITFDTDDLAMQNIQARVRNPGIWMLANLFDSILLCTSNRSEGAVGYCTMDGDTSGGLAPLAGVDKAYIRRWLRWLESVGPAGIGPLPELSVVTRQSPRPELRPLAAEQTAEKDLMPYEVLDAIEELSIENNRSPLECYHFLRKRFPKRDGDELGRYIEKFFDRWSKNQWKRERLPAALHVASRNLDPRTWRRSPILSGAFKKELRLMWDFIEQEKQCEQSAHVAHRSESDDWLGADGAEPGHSDAASGSKSIDSNGAGKSGSNRGSNTSSRKALDLNKAALLIVDAQKGFGSNGELPVPEAEAIVPVINSMMPVFKHIFATQDWHPADHISFAINHAYKKVGDTLQMDGYEQPLYPMHCIEDTRGSQFLDGLETGSIQKTFRKGNHPDRDAFSPFLDIAGNTATDAERHLKDLGIETLFVCGLTTNVCVKETALQALDLGFDVFIVEDACRGVDMPGSKLETAVAKLKARGITFVPSAEVLALAPRKKRRSRG